jgi:hypothetical protein
VPCLSTGSDSPSDRTTQLWLLSSFVLKLRLKDPRLLMDVNLKFFRSIIRMDDLKAKVGTIESALQASSRQLQSLEVMMQGIFPD